jgi:CBS domain containing-hemolysin-like protein
MSLFLFILAFGFVFLNAFFVAAEFAMVKLRHSRVQGIRENYGIQGRVLFQVHKHLETYLSACQLGITLASLGLGWVGEPAFASLLEPVFHRAGIQSVDLVELIAFSIAFSVISFLHIVVGELMPKTMAIRQSEKISLYTAIPLYLFYWLMYPFIWVLNYSAVVLLRCFRLDAVHHGEQTYSAEEIKFILKSSHIHDTLKQEHKDMLIRMLEFVDVEAVDIMRPLEEMISINQHAPAREKLKLIKQHRYTRYPVYQDKPDEIIGILHTKDLLLEDNDFSVALRPVVKVSRHTKAVKILERFRQGMPHFALVYHHKKLIGFITLDNLLHALIGKMRDEFNLTWEDWQQLPDGSFLIKGLASVYVIEKLLNIDLSAYRTDTVAGETWAHPNFILRAQKVEGHRIVEVNLMPSL